MDGISVAASILGLVGAAAKVTIYLNALVTSVKTAPQLAQSVLLEVSGVSVCLSQLQRLLLGMERGSKSGEHLIMIEQLFVVLANCVSIFSELEEVLESLGLVGGTHISKTKIASWLRRQQSIVTLLMRLQASKQSLTLIVTTLNCTSVGEAEDAVSELKASITQILESNLVLAERMANLELQQSAHALSKAPNSTQDGEDYLGKSGTTLRQEERVLDHGETSRDSSIPAPSDKGKDKDSESIVTAGRIGFAFEEDLFASRPYLRAINRRPCWSATSSVVPTMGWSYLSGLSLADVSEVSILSLPLSLLELWNGQSYIAARDELEDSVGVTGQQRQASVTPIRSMTTNEYPAVSSWLFGKLFDRWDSFPERRLWQLISSQNVVLLGVPSSGKRTIHRRLQSIYGYKFSKLDRINACRSIIYGLVETFKVAWKKVRHSERGDSALKDVEDDYRTLVSRDERKDTCDFRFCRALLRLWAHDSLRYEIQSGTGLDDWYILWFFEHLEPLFLDTSMLSDSLLQRPARESSECFHQCQLVDFDGTSCSYELFDARGGISRRKNWLSRFDVADAFIFVVPLSSYCQRQAGSASLNMMKHQIRFFDTLTRLGKVRDIPIILLLNKTDVLEQLIAIKPISDYFEDYAAGANCFHACQFFADKFAKSDRRENGDLRIYGTSAVHQSGFQQIIKDLHNLPRSYNETDPWSRLGGEASIHNPVAKPSVDKMLRKHNEEGFSRRKSYAIYPQD